MAETVNLTPEDRKTRMALNGGCMGIIALVFVLLTVVALHQRQQGKDSAHWPTAEGVITASKIATDSDGRPSFEVAYRFEVEGTTYQGDRLTFDQSLPERGEAERKAKRYPVDQKVAVHFHAQDPEQSVLEPGASGVSAVAVVAIMGAIAGMLGGLFAFDYSRVRNAPFDGEHYVLGAQQSRRVSADELEL